MCLKFFSTKCFRRCAVIYNFDIFWYIIKCIIVIFYNTNNSIFGGITMKIYEITFSATGRTQKVTDIISSVFEGDKTRIDISNPNFKDKIYEISQDSFCIVSVPVYNGRVPTPAVDNLKNIKGNVQKFVLLVQFHLIIHLVLTKASV